MADNGEDENRDERQGGGANDGPKGSREEFPFKPPSLEQIESEGRTAAKAAAAALVRETIRNGGQIDIARLRTLGPDVEQEYMQILGERAAAPPTPKPSAQPTTTARVATASKPATAKSKAAPGPSTPTRPSGDAIAKTKPKGNASPPAKIAPVALSKPSSPPRLQTGWRDQRCAKSDFATIAFRRGLVAACVAGFLAILAIAHFNF